MKHVAAISRGLKLAAPVSFLCVVVSGLPGTADAQLAECNQIGGSGIVATVPGSCISKSMLDQIGAGHGDEYTSGTGAYLIKRDPARSIRRGRQLFQRKFSHDEGLGPRVNTGSLGDINVSRALGAGLADSCAMCHGRPRGAAGFGGDVATFPDSRDAPHLFGLGLIEMLADEMTAELRLIREGALQMAVDGAAVASDAGQSFAGFPGTGNKSRPVDSGINADGSVTRRLRSKGVDFGEITAYPDGAVDTSKVKGVDEDLRIKPFFHHGGTVSIREFVIGAFNDEMGLQAWDPILCAVTDPDAPQLMVSPSGFVFDPESDAFKRPPACDPQSDPDYDGKGSEIDPALVDHMEFYLLNYFKPGQYEVTRRAERGRRLMHAIGCTGCHVQNLTVKRDRRVADVETAYDPERGVFNSLFAEATTRFQVADDGYDYPLVLPEEQPFLVRNVFTDLKRHDLGPQFHERDYNGERITAHVTEPLWGVGSTAPYGHDGRSVNLDSVIRRHGGEAARVTAAYRRLGAESRGMILEFLQTLILFPPDDTASNLNPGDPQSDDPQDPANHGSINLGALFQTAIEESE